MKTTYFKKQSTFLLAAAISGVIHAPTTLADGLSLEEIVVTAQKREQSANDIGMAITAFSGDALKEMNVTSTDDLAAVTPGLTYADTGLSAPVYTLRGVGFNEESIQATATVGVYNDQIAVPFPAMTRGLLMDVERVEVMKGPQGTLFGRNSTGGAINYIANKPTEEFEAGLTGGYGSYETVDVEGYVSGPIADNIRGRFVAKTIHAGEGWQESVSRDDELGEKDRKSARLILDMDISEDLFASLSMSWWEDQSDAQAPQLIGTSYQQVTGNPVVEGLLGNDFVGKDTEAAEWAVGKTAFGKPKNDVSSHAVSLTLNWDINEDMTLTSLTSYSEYENQSNYNMDGFAGASYADVNALGLISVPAQGIYDGDEVLGSSAFQQDAEIEAFSQELRLSGSRENMTWILGAYYSQDEVRNDMTQAPELATNSNIGAFGISLQFLENKSLQEGETWAVFGHTEWDLSDNTKLTVGLRHTDDKKDFEGCTRDVGYGDASHYLNTFLGGPVTESGGCLTFNNTDNPNLPGVDTLGVGLVENELDETSTSGKIALDYNLTDDIMTYISYSRGFKSGSFPTLVTNDPSQLDPVNQEKLIAWEVGVKASLLDGAMQFNAAAFDYDYTDKQLLSRTITPFGALNALANVPESKVQGVEFDLQWQPLEGLFVAAAATFVDTEIEEFSGYNQHSLFGDMSGSEFPLTPEFQASLLVNYEWDLNSDLVAFVGTDLNYSAESYADYAISEVVDPGTANYNLLVAREGATVGAKYDVDEPFKLDSSLLIGLRAGVKAADESWRVSAWGRNITDEFNPVNARKNTDMIIRFNGMGATYGITASYHWM